ncbi:ABC-2 type transport system permease protein [Amycolatopsis xylanica]|uniref:ABC-2 type transport system permease protein n=1 Tax=Amycolatopsis xylanica TaxID=589385 RepID=A0A1H3PN94_9PSEU|nr:ABC transporter permease [Amycolatopsis xylanica]SDZ02722.1 ABC-2 type transport system permease protein [Amycolatopsis xylanica]
MTKPGDAIASEWTKFWSVRATWWSLAAAAVLMAAYSVMGGWAIARAGETGSVRSIAINGAFYMAQFPVIAVATLFVTSEYASGSIRSSLLWVPVRNRLLLAKSAVLLPVLSVLGAALAGLAMVVGGFVAGDHASRIPAGEVVLTIAGMAAYFALLGLLCLGIGTALRSTAGAIVSVIVLLLMVPMLVGALGADALIDYFPGFAGINGMLPKGELNPVFHTPTVYAPWIGMLSCAAWSVGALAAGSVLLRKRDA